MDKVAKSKFETFAKEREKYTRLAKDFMADMGVSLISEMGSNIIIGTNKTSKANKLKMKELARKIGVELHTDNNYCEGVTRMWFYVGNVTFIAFTRGE